MDCLVLPDCLLRKRSSMRSRLGYRPLKSEEDGCGEAQVTVVVGKQKREFLVDSFVLEKSPFRVLIETMKKGVMDGRREKEKVIFVDVDDILFEHMLWLMNNDRSSLFQLNLEEIIDFYAQDY
ncbi:putative DNA-binding protein ESCAROLA-like [Hibiscus syriacus]|uniref:DNA-binding protein ESCAROLA-like n=1 Tax=Hibiscus syriacus TaxID=106335 RepID=A0A6A2XYU0_HIBSY|nr:putative DNA-binding protein ESCAROLA-like [Hibiscus syriacus]